MKKSLLIFVILFSISVSHILAQGVTSAALNGQVKDETGEGLPGATVIAIHLATGSEYGTVTNLEGNYIFANLKVGAYKITFSYVGYESQVHNNLNLVLGKNTKLDVQLGSESTELDAVEIVAKRNDGIDPSRTGASTNISQEQVQALPSLSRNLADFARLTPQFSSKNGGLSFAGQNNRYNNISIDGAVNNDVFGLSDGGTPGDRQGAQPISLDAIEQLQVVIAPFDVRQSGFTGGGVNAVTKSGTNELEGSIYFYGRNNKMIGSKIGNSGELQVTEFKDYQTGLRIGGPIIKNKAFYFFNYERGVRSTPPNDYVRIVADRQATPELRAQTYNTYMDLMDDMRDIMRRRFDYDPGDPRVLSDLVTANDKFFFRTDINLSNKHKLIYRVNYTDAFKTEIFGSTSNFSFNQSAYDLDFKVLGNVVELQSLFSNTLSNEFRVSYNRIRDRSIPEGRDFPSIRVNGLPIIATAVTGLDRFRGANNLSQDLIEITDNLTWFKGNHVITLGTRNEIYKFDNLFITSFGGEWTFPYDANFESLDQGLPSEYIKNYSLTNNLRQSAEWSAVLLGLYAQDEWNVSDNLKLTLGVRADLPMMNGEVNRNYKFEESFLLRNDITPKKRVLWSPRIGFNWNVKGEDNTQIRGGLGIFTGRPPFVWLSNQYTRDGVSFGNSVLDSEKIKALFEGQDQEVIDRDLSNPYYIPNVDIVGQQAEINITNPNFKLPQIARLNFAIDQKLPENFLLTFDAIYSKSINEIYVTDINLKNAQRVISEENNREIYFENSSNYAGNAISRIDAANYTSVYVLENTNQGYQYSLTLQLQRNAGPMFSSLAYTYGQSRDISSLSNSTASGNFQNLIAGEGNINSPGLAISNFDQPHRVVGAMGYNLKTGNWGNTQISVFYNGQSGNRYSYTVGGNVDLNGDGIRGNELMYIPLDRDDILLEDIAGGDAYKELFKVIQADPSLNNRKGLFAERNSELSPWENQFDIRVLQSIHARVMGKKHSFQVSLDILNVGNMLNPEWGLKFSGRRNIVDFTGFDATSGRPMYRLNQAYNTDYFNSFSTNSVWQMQLGVRYSF